MLSPRRFPVGPCSGAGDDVTSLHAPEYQYKVCSFSGVVSPENTRRIRGSMIKWGTLEIQELDKI